MDVKTSLDVLFEERDARIKAEADAKAAVAQDASSRRNTAITQINTIVEPVLKEFERDIKNRGYEANYSVDLVSGFPEVTFQFRVPSTMPSVRWQPSTFRMRFAEGVVLESGVWGANGKTTAQLFPPSVKRDVIDREFVVSTLSTFVKAVLDQTI